MNSPYATLEDLPPEVCGLIAGFLQDKDALNKIYLIPSFRDLNCFDCWIEKLSDSGYELNLKEEVNDKSDDTGDAKNKIEVRRIPGTPRPGARPVTFSSNKVFPLIESYGIIVIHLERFSAGSVIALGELLKKVLQSFPDKKIRISVKQRKFAFAPYLSRVVKEYSDNFLGIDYLNVTKLKPKDVEIILDRDLGTMWYFPKLAFVSAPLSDRWSYSSQLSHMLAPQLKKLKMLNYGSAFGKKVDFFNFFRAPSLRRLNIGDNYRHGIPSSPMIDIQKLFKCLPNLSNLILMPKINFQGLPSCSPGRSLAKIEFTCLKKLTLGKVQTAELKGLLQIFTRLEELSVYQFPDDLELSTLLSPTLKTCDIIHVSSDHSIFSLCCLDFPNLKSMKLYVIAAIAKMNDVNVPKLSQLKFYWNSRQDLYGGIEVFKRIKTESLRELSYLLFQFDEFNEFMETSSFKNLNRVNFHLQGLTDDASFEEQKIHFCNRAREKYPNSSCRFTFSKF